ncbi:MAG: beta-lactamase family protein, partial [Deltaproteobacteria bacterium]|nr:beta-lactamase family protein [Deltaproteobacteria bacterium]
PGAALVAGRGGEVVFSRHAGHRSVDPPGPAVDEETIFDLGSLTKPLITTLALMRLVDLGRLDLDRPVAELLPGSPAAGKRITSRLLLCHAAGLPAWRDYYVRLDGVDREMRKAQCRAWILEEAPAYEPGTGCVYSDPGFMLLEWVVEQVSGLDMGAYVDLLFLEPLGFERMFLFRTGEPLRFRKELYAATEYCPWRGRLLQGEVHDENAFALGGYSGHAGLFGTAVEVFSMARLLRDHLTGERNDLFHPETVRAFFQREDRIRGCRRALGWDTPSAEGSAAGRYFSGYSVGHLGFPGTSLWMDLEKDVQVVFLTNRVHPTRENRRIQGFRPRIHDCVMQELGFA